MTSQLKKWIPVFLSILTLWPVQEALAWGPAGHRIIGEIAEARLSPEAKSEIRKNFNIKKLSNVAVWADIVRKRRSEGPWHYCNIKESEWTYNRERDCPKGDCVVEKIGSFTQVFMSKRISAKKRGEALKYLIHFVADVHQPLHLGNARDRGGNTIEVKYRGKRRNLHALWDGGLIYFAGKSLVQYSGDLNLRVRPEEARMWNSSGVTEWADESRALALHHAYQLDRPFRGRLSKEYIERSREIIELRLTQAGVRLAGLLNRLLSPARDAGTKKRSQP